MSRTRNDVERRRMRMFEAELRAEERAARSDIEQIQRLELNGHKYCKEWKRLMAKIAKAADR